MNLPFADLKRFLMFWDKDNSDNESQSVSTARPLPVNLVDSSGNPMSINASGQLHVVLMGKVIAGNSTSATLNADAVFTGTAVETLDFGFIFVTVFSDVASATNGLSVEQSSDGNNWDNTDNFTIPAGTGKTYSFQPAAKWFRIVYTNGDTNQAAFRLQTIFKKTSSLPSSHRISNNLSPEDDGSLVIAVIKGQNPSGAYVDYSATSAGNFKVSVEEIQNKISTNNSTISVLNGDAVFTGVADDVSNFANVTIQLDSSHDSAVDGMTFQFSTDNTNWDDIYTFTYTASEGARRFQFPATAKYFRVVYTNGSTLQTHFRVQTILHVSDILTSIHRLKDPVSPDRSLELVKSALLANDGKGGDFKIVDASNPLPVSEKAQTAFGELSVAEATPVVQVQFPYNINTDIWETRDNNGSSSVVNNMANLSTGAVANQSSTIITRNFLKYNPGQGALVRFTALYTTGVANNTQWVGIGDTDDGFFFGYNGSTFGILRRQGGKPETRRLAITTASNTAEDITITLNGVAENVTVSAAGADSTTTRVVTANEIVNHDWSDVGEGWEVHNMGANVFFTSFSDGSKSGTFEITTATTAVGTFAQSLAGVSATETIVSQANWSEDTLDGSSDANNPSGITLDQTKGNVYQIRYQWLGFGGIEFFVEHGADAELHLVHRIEYANTNTVPSIDNPTLPLCISTTNTSNTSDVVVKVGSMGGFVEGRDTLPGLPHSLSIESNSISTTETPVLTIHAHDIYQGTLNRVKIKMTSGSVSTDGTKNSIIRIRKNAILTGPVSFSALDSNISTIHRDTAATGVSGGTIVFAKGVEKVGFVDIDLEKLGITLTAPDFLTTTIQATGGATVDVVATSNWQELF